MKYSSYGRTTPYATLRVSLCLPLCPRALSPGRTPPRTPRARRGLHTGLSPLASRRHPRDPDRRPVTGDRPPLSSPRPCLDRASRSRSHARSKMKRIQFQSTNKRKNANALTSRLSSTVNAWQLWGTAHTHTAQPQSSSARQKCPKRVCAADPEPHLARKVRDQAVRAYCTVKPLCESITAVNAEPEASMYLTFTREAATEEESPPLAWSPQVTTLPSSLIAANATWFA